MVAFSEISRIGFFVSILAVLVLLAIFPLSSAAVDNANSTAAVENSPLENTTAATEGQAVTEKPVSEGSAEETEEDLTTTTPKENDDSAKSKSPPPNYAKLAAEQVEEYIKGLDSEELKQKAENNKDALIDEAKKALETGKDKAVAVGDAIGSKLTGFFDESKTDLRDKISEYSAVSANDFKEKISESLSNLCSMMSLFCDNDGNSIHFTFTALAAGLVATMLTR